MLNRRARRVVYLALVVLALILWFREPPEVELPAPVVERLRSLDRDGPERATLADLVNWGRQSAPMVLVDVTRDALPNGLAVAMVPFLVDWEHADRDGRSVRVRNVNVAGNITAGEVLLATVEVPVDGVSAVEWCVTPTRNKDGEDTRMAHAQLRFLFAPGARPFVVDEDGAPYPQLRPLDDLVLSWEAWRPPQTRYDAVAGFDPEAYALTARAYSGAFRWLGDALRGNPWMCYPLELPETQDANRSTLMTALLLGDALARRMLESMVDAGEAGLPDDALAAWQALPDAERAQVRAVMSSSALPDDPLSALMGQADLSYQLLERSCITQSIGVVQLALERIHDENGLGPAPSMQIVPDDLPDWVENIATAGKGEMLGYVPGALLYVARNQQIIPTEAYRILQDAGLLRMRDGAPVYWYYEHNGKTPYGEFRDNLM